MSNSPESPASVSVLMAAQADEFVKAAQSAGLGLDYLARTLPIAEKFVKATPAEGVRMAAYLGEVIRRETKGFWFDSDGTALVYTGIEPYVDPSAVVDALIAHGRAEVAGTVVESAKAYCELVCRLQKQWLDRAVLGNYDSMSALRTSMAADARTAGLVLGLAQSAVLTAQLDWTEALDASPDSLDAVERILGSMHNLVAKGDGRAAETQIDALSKSMGVYIGEIIRRHYGGQWRVTESGGFELPYTNSIVYPIARARKRIHDGPGENIRMYFNSMGKIIAS
jgi:hypothetical protein